MRESKIEKEVCDYAESKGVVQYKFTSPGEKGVPDRMFIVPDWMHGMDLSGFGFVFFIEFKAPNKTPDKKQKEQIARITGCKVDVFVVDNIDDGKSIIDRYSL